MKKLTILISGLLFLTCSFSQRNLSLIDKQSEALGTKTCSDVAPEKRLLCIGQERTRSGNILADAGEITSVKILEKDGFCQKVELQVTYGSKLEEDLQMKRKHIFTVCRYADLSDKLMDMGVAFGIGYVSGVITGVVITK